MNPPGPGPQTAEAYNNQADAKRAKGDLDGAMADFNKALSQLYFLEGSILERNHIGVEAK